MSTLCGWGGQLVRNEVMLNHFKVSPQRRLSMLNKEIKAQLSSLAKSEER